MNEQQQQEEFLAALGMAGGRAADALVEFATGSRSLDLCWTTARIAGDRPAAEGEVAASIQFEGLIAGEAKLMLSPGILPYLVGEGGPAVAGLEIAEVVLHAFIGVLANLATTELVIHDLIADEPLLAAETVHSIRLAAVREQSASAVLLVSFRDQDAARPLLRRALLQLL